MQQQLNIIAEQFAAAQHPATAQQAADQHLSGQQIGPNIGQQQQVSQDTQSAVTAHGQSVPIVQQQVQTAADLLAAMGAQQQQALISGCQSLGQLHATISSSQQQQPQSSDSKSLLEAMQAHAEEYLAQQQPGVRLSMSAADFIANIQAAATAATAALSAGHHLSGGAQGRSTSSDSSGSSTSSGYSSASQSSFIARPVFNSVGGNRNYSFDALVLVFI